MGFAGNLRTLSLAEVVQTLHRIKADGVLRLASPTATRDVIFSLGDIIGVSSIDGSDRKNLLKRLVLANRARQPSAEEFIAADHTITALVEIGTITPDDLQDQSKQQALEELYDLNTWPSADFVFHEITESTEWAERIEEARKQPLEINVNSVLMEAARRLDEWELLKDAFRDDQVVRLNRESESDLEPFSKDYPGSLLIPLLDGPRAIEDLLVESGVTRFACYGLFSDLMEAGLLAVLSLEELDIEADRMAAEGDHQRAAQIYRRALASATAGTGAMAKLAASLEQVGDAPEAAGCYAQLALSQMDEGNGEVAMDCAKRAVELAPRDPDAHVALVRCLIGTEQIPLAVEEMRSLAELYKELGRVEDARTTYRKILELTPGDDGSRHALAAIQVRQDGAESGDVVVCVECGTVNNRELEECSNCHARLHLQCLTCSRTVSVADKICVFCGADPHTAPTGDASARRAPVGPRTERISDPSKLKPEVAAKGSAFWRSELRRLLDEARAHEAAGRFEDALKSWREVGRLQSDNAELVQHIRDLEGLIHDQFTEVEIERGHRLKRQRRYWRALLAYKAALRSIGENDPRVGRLRELIAATSRSNTRIFAIYLAAFAIIVVTAGLVAKPYFDVRMIERRSQEAVASLSGQVAPDAITAAAMEFDELSIKAERLSGVHRNHANTDVDSVKAALVIARERFLAATLSQVDTALTNKTPEQALAAIAAAGPIVGATGDERLHTAREKAEQLQRALQDVEKRRQQAPELLAKAISEEEAGHLAGAMRLYREVISIGVKETLEDAQAGIDRLEPLAAAYAKAWKEVEAVIAADLLKGQVRLQQLVAEAGKWEAAEALVTKQQWVAERLITAENAWKAIPEATDEATLTTFLTDFSNAPQTTMAKARLGQLRAAARARDAALAQYAEAVTAKQWETAYSLAAALHQNYAASLKAGEVRLPLVIDSDPSGATVTVDGKEIGRAPLTFAYEPKSQPRQIVLMSPGYVPRTIAGADAIGSWRVQVSLDREALWRSSLGKSIGLLAAMPDGGCLVGVGDLLMRLKPDGTQVWSHAVDGGGLGDGQSLVGPAPLDLGAGQWALALGGAGFLVINDTGDVVRSLQSPQSITGRPVRFRNDIRGGEERVAYAADAIYCGPLAGEAAAIPIPAPAIGGPIVLTADLDRVLVVPDIRGHFVAIEESTQRLVWDKDLRFTEISALVQTAADQAIGVVDGSRLAAWKMSVAGVQESWSRRLDAPAVGSLAFIAGVAHIASGLNVVRVRLDGGGLPMLTLPSPATAGVAALGDLLVVGCRQHIIVFKDGKVAWTAPCTSSVTAVTIGVGKVLVGLADGTVAAFQP